MNDIIKSGYGIGTTLKKMGYSFQARNALMKVLTGYATYEEKLRCVFDLATLAGKSVPFSIIEEDNNKDLIMFMLGITNGLTKPINDVVTVKEASEMVKKDVSAIKRAINSGKLVEGTDCRKSGATWLIEKEALLREFKK